jgi:hypothetical protein
MSSSLRKMTSWLRHRPRISEPRDRFRFRNGENQRRSDLLHEEELIRCARGIDVASPGEPAPSAAEASVDVAVAITQRDVETRFAKQLNQSTEQVVTSHQAEVAARHAAATALAEPIGRQAHALAVEQSRESMALAVDRHEPGGGRFLLWVLRIAACIGDFGFNLAMFSRSISPQLPWYAFDRLMAMGMSLAISAVSVALADHAGRQLRPLWTKNGDKRMALARAGGPLIATVIASWATFRLVEFRFGSGGMARFSVVHLPAGVIATLVVMLLWVILLLESQRASAAPHVDPRVAGPARIWDDNQKAATSQVILTAAESRRIWLAGAHQVDLVEKAMTEVYAPGAQIILEHRALHGIVRSSLVFAGPSSEPSAKSAEVLAGYPTSFGLRSILTQVESAQRCFHLVERSIGVLAAHRPSGMSDAQETVEEMYKNLDTLARAASRRWAAPASDASATDVSPSAASTTLVPTDIVATMDAPAGDAPTLPFPARRLEPATELDLRPQNGSRFETDER